MTDMRATGRLLEVIDERQASIRKTLADGEETAAAAKVHSDALDIKEAINELRRRGDVLVLREDLRAILRHVDPLGADVTLESALQRLGRTLGSS